MKPLTAGLLGLSGVFKCRHDDRGLTAWSAAASHDEPSPAQGFKARVIVNAIRIIAAAKPATDKDPKAAGNRRHEREHDHAKTGNQVCSSLICFDNTERKHDVTAPNGWAFENARIVHRLLK